MGGGEACGQLATMQPPGLQTASPLGDLQMVTVTIVQERKTTSLIVLLPQRWP